jgi:toxin YoeB
VKYIVIINDTAKSGIDRHKEAGEIITLRKINSLLYELENTPKIGTGRPKLLGGDLSGIWSRRITQRHRLLYTIDEENFIVKVVSTFGHYYE